MAARHGVAGEHLGHGGEPGGHERLPGEATCRLPSVPHQEQERPRHLSRRLRRGSQPERGFAGRPEMTAEGALTGLRVIDLSRVLAGPLCTQTLGDLGAEVIKVERPGAGDDTRNWGPPYAGPLSAYFIGVNRNKRSLALDLSRPEGRAVLDRLIRSGDVLVDNFRQGTLAR